MLVIYFYNNCSCNVAAIIKIVAKDGHRYVPAPTVVGIGVGIGVVCIRYWCSIRYWCCG